MKFIDKYEINGSIFKIYNTCIKPSYFPKGRQKFITTLTK